MNVCACGKEFANKSNFNRHMKKCQAVSIDSVIDIDSAIATAHAHASPPTDIPDVPEYGGGQSIEVTKIPKNCELIIAVSLPEHSRVFFDHIDEQDPEMIHVKIDNMTVGRVFTKTHVSNISMVMVEEP
jgi:hypothetical protein